MKFLLPALPLALLAIAAGAPAAAGEQARSVRIATRDLDLANPADARLLERRIGRALTAVCGAYDGGSFAQMEEVHRCRKAARASMRPDPTALVSQVKRRPAQRVAAH